MTEPLFRDDAYLREAETKVIAINDRGGIVLKATNFYATSGGQPGDSGCLRGDFGECAIATSVYDSDRQTIVHVPADGAVAPPVGATVTACVDWARRHALMRVHTALHLLCSAVPFPVTGGQIGAGDGRLDFDIQSADAIERDALSERLQQLVSEDHAVTTRWISDQELAANPDLVRTMAVKPPMGSGRVRLVAIGTDGEVDLQPCGGTHVNSTGEIGPISVTKVEKKGKQNRRIRIALA